MPVVPNEALQYYAQLPVSMKDSLASGQRRVVNDIVAFLFCFPFNSHKEPIAYLVPDTTGRAPRLLAHTWRLSGSLS